MHREKRPDSPLLKVFGDRLRAARLAKGMSIFDLAYVARVDWSYVTQIEGGRKNPSLNVLDALATAVELPLSEMLTAPTVVAVGEGKGSDHDL